MLAARRESRLNNRHDMDAIDAFFLHVCHNGCTSAALVARLPWRLHECHSAASLTAKFVVEG
jgi:hypothetical protein